MTHPSFRSLSQAVEAYYEELRRFVSKRTGSASLAEDVVQETWIRASRSASPMPDNPRAYLYRMAGNLVVDQLRSRASQIPEPACERTEQEPDDALLRLVCPAPGPEAAAISREELALLTEAVQELPDKCRQVFLLYRGRGMSMKAVAARLGLSVKTVEKHIARAMVHCRQKLRRAGRDV